MAGHKKSREREERKKKKNEKKMVTRAKSEFCFLYSSPLYRVDTEKNLKIL
jgi:hypothetical protein